MTDADTSLHVRVNRSLKNEAAQILDDYGLSTSEAIRLFLFRVVDSKSFPLEMEIPNARVRAGMAETEKMIEEHRARFSTEEELLDELEKDSRK